MWVFLAQINQIQYMLGNTDKRRCDDFTAFKQIMREKIDFHDFVSATRNLTPNFIKLKTAYRQLIKY